MHFFWPVLTSLFLLKSCLALVNPLTQTLMKQPQQPKSISATKEAVSDIVSFNVKAADSLISTVFAIKPLFNIAKNKGELM